MAFTSAQREILTELGRRIQKRREGKGLSLQGLGDLIDRDRQAIHRIEKGQVNPGFLLLQLISSALDTTVSDLTEGL